MTRTAGASERTRVCASCGRAFGWRKRWARCWEQVRYCSSACRRRGVNAVDRGLESAILELLETRAPGASICPSEAARAVAPGQDWRALMEPARRTARRLAERGLVEICQRGRVVDPADFRGPVRLRRVRGSRAR